MRPDLKKQIPPHPRANSKVDDFKMFCSKDVDDSTFGRIRVC